MRNDRLPLARSRFLRLRLGALLLFLVITLDLLIPGVSGHMEMTNPPPLRSKFNSNTNREHIDYEMKSPLSANGDNFPCRGSLSLLGTPEAASVATYSPGGTYKMTIEGTAQHRGGSCQTSLSLDGGNTFRVIKSYIGGCPDPAHSRSELEFTIPGDTPATRGAIFAWSWFNLVGNREMYMNCAVVDIAGAGDTAGAGGEGFSSRPELFTANLGKGCSTVERQLVEFPDPGPDVQRAAAGGAENGNVKRTGAGGLVGDSCAKPPVSTDGSASNINDGEGGGGDSGAGQQTTNSPSSEETPSTGTSWKSGNDWPSSYHPNTSLPEAACS